MKIFHHIDADGLCAAAIVRNTLSSVFDVPTEKDFIGYNYSGNIDLPEDYISEKETIYIVDLSLDDVIFELIKRCVNMGCNIVHIDHHKTTLDFIDNMSDDKKLIMDNVTKFYKVGISGSLLTWVYSCMDENERKHCNTVLFDFAEKRTHVAFNYDSPNDMREYRIPTVIRFIDDNDVWIHDIDETKYFCIAFQMETDKSPYNDLWDNLIYGSEMNVYKYVNDGKLLFKYQRSVDSKKMLNAFEYEIDGHTALCVNASYGNSRIFGEKFDQYPLVCKYNYNGVVHKWRYSFYSSQYNPDAVDVSKIVKKFGGGGHKHAAGCMLDKNIFEDHTN